MAQPNFSALAQSFAGIAHEITLLSNMPAPRIQEQLQQIQDQMDQNHQQFQDQTNDSLQQILDKITQLIDSQQTITQRLQAMEQRTLQRLDQLDNLLPIRVANHVAKVGDPLAYPPGVDLASLPRTPPGTKLGLLHMTADTCAAMARVLGLPALPKDTPIAIQRQQITDHLGAPWPTR